MEFLLNSKSQKFDMIIIDTVDSKRFSKFFVNLSQSLPTTLMNHYKNGIASELYSIKNSTYALPLYIEYNMLYSNQDLLNKYNLDIPKTWDELFDIAKLIVTEEKNLINENDVIESHANIDLEIFVKIAKILDINVRYVGEEPNSIVTGIYNKIMETKLPNFGINCIIVPRKNEKSGEIISASNVRKLIKEENFDIIKEIVPESTYKYLISQEAKPIIEKIKQIEDVVHY